jgi:hypothetical protein
MLPNQRPYMDIIDEIMNNCRVVGAYSGFNSLDPDPLPLAYVVPPLWPRQEATPTHVSILDVLNDEKLALTGISVGQQVRVSDGFVVSGHSVAAANGFYFYYTATTYLKSLPFLDDGSDFRAHHDGTSWFIGSDNDGTVSAANGNETYPWEADWSGVGITLTHPALQQLAAASTTVAGVVVLGGTQDGIFLIHYAIGIPPFDRDNDSYLLLGNTDFRLRWTSSMWLLDDIDDNHYYYSLSDVATPDLALNWKNAADDTPASITVATVTQGELDAGVTVAGAGTSAANGAYDVRNSYDGRQHYNFVGQPTDFDARSILNGAGFWVVNDTEGSAYYIATSGSAFPWGQTFDVGAGDPPAPTVTRNDIASEANWDNV